MKISRLVTFLLGLLVGLSAVILVVAQRTATLSQRIVPLLRPAGESQMDWGLMKARLSNVEEQVNVLSEVGISSCCAQYWYDVEKDKIIARYRFSPDTLNRLTAPEAKERLSKAALWAIGGAKSELERQRGVTLEQNDFEVEFVTWNEHAQFKTFAVYKNGQLVFPDRLLK